MQQLWRLAALSTAMWILATADGNAQGERRMYIGGLFGVSTLSGDARTVTTETSALASLYKPENGPALNLFVGAHLWRFVTVQGNYIWDRNDLRLFSSASVPAGRSVFYEQPRDSSQHAFVADALVYFRALGSGVRPYLGAGLAVIRFRSSAAGPAIVNGFAPPAGDIESTDVALRSHVGIDFALGRAWSFRYSFSETIGGNPISPHLMPPGERGLANFQNLFGMVRSF
jgi:hypothetical protein